MSRPDDGVDRTGTTGSKLRALIAALSLLVLGAVLGIVIDRHIFTRTHPISAAAVHEAAMSSLEERLDLTAAQRRQIDSLLADRHDVLRAAWRNLHAQLGAAVDSVHEDIEAVLTPEQRAGFRAWLANPRTAHPRR